MFLPYMGIADILFNDAELFEQTDNTTLTEGRKFDLAVKRSNVILSHHLNKHG